MKNFITALAIMAIANGQGNSCDVVETDYCSNNSDCRGERFCNTGNCVGESGCDMTNQDVCNGAYSLAVEAEIYCMKMEEEFDCYYSNGYGSEMERVTAGVLEAACAPDLYPTYINN